MRKASKVIVAFALVLSMTFGVSGKCQAATEICEGNGSRSFSKEWQASKSLGNASLVYGFDKHLVNEDYAWAYHSKKQHYARIYNGNGSHLSSWKAAGKTATVEVRHKGTNVVYYCMWH